MKITREKLENFLANAVWYKMSPTTSYFITKLKITGTAEQAHHKCLSDSDDDDYDDEESQSVGIP